MPARNPMLVTADPKEWRVVVRLDSEVEEASYVYDLVQSGRLQVQEKDHLPLPFRGQFLFKLPAHPRPIAIQVGRLEPTAAEALAGGGGLRLLVACPRGPEEVLRDLEAALRDVPPASEEEFKAGAAGTMDEYSRVRKMTFAQRVIFATRAGQSGRAVLMQQPSSLLLLYLCKNPLITLPEIVQIAGLPSIDALVGEYIVKMLRANPQWAMSEELKLALVTNPKTAIGTALSLLSRLSERSLRNVTKHGDVRGAIKQAAMKVLMDHKG